MIRPLSISERTPWIVLSGVVGSRVSVGVQSVVVVWVHSLVIIGIM